jgi:hypothetical protein
MRPTWELTSDVLDMLVLEGLTSPSTAWKIRTQVQESWLPIGKILRQRGRITMDQMTRLLVLQTSEPHLRLGELAVREGFCTEEDIREALRLQREASPHALEVFLSEAPCDKDQLIQVLVRYVRYLEGRTSGSPLRDENESEARRAAS